MKRIAALLLTSVICLMSFSACGKVKESDISVDALEEELSAFGFEFDIKEGESFTAEEDGVATLIKIDGQLGENNNIKTVSYTATINDPDLFNYDSFENITHDSLVDLMNGAITGESIDPVTLYLVLSTTEMVLEDVYTADPDTMGEYTRKAINSKAKSDKWSYEIKVNEDKATIKAEMKYIGD